MRGDGIKTAITPPEMAGSRLLDVTRSLRRAGRVATGVDRVEIAYLDQFLTDEIPFFALARTALGYVLLDRDGAQTFRDKLAGDLPWGAPSMLSRLVMGRDRALVRAESDLRRLAVGRAIPANLGKMLQALLPDTFAYYNVGHSNLTDRMLKSVKSAGGGIHVLVHDVIPLEFPQFQRAGTVAPFRAKIDRVARLADRVIYNSHDTRQRSEAFMRLAGRVPDAIVAHLGVTIPQPDLKALPSSLPPSEPYFVTVGTIEPRKNHAFLLDLWAQMGTEAPLLLICGSRGWNNAAVFDRLDQLPRDGKVREVSGLSDPALAALVAGASGLLFPSLAEGFGLPAVEAMALKTRVLCNDLPVFREVTDDKAVYAPVSDGYLWTSTIKEWGSSPAGAWSGNTFKGSGWAEHFNTVLRSR